MLEPCEIDNLYLQIDESCIFIMYFLYLNDKTFSTAFIQLIDPLGIMENSLCAEIKSLLAMHSLVPIFSLYICHANMNKEIIYLAKRMVMRSNQANELLKYFPR